MQNVESSPARFTPIIPDFEPIIAEFESLSLGDARLHRRVPALAARLAEDPSSPFPKLLNRPELKALYRFANNPYFGLPELIAPHRRNTAQRCEAEGEVLVIHDTTECSFAGDAQRKGLGRMRSGGQGFFLHVSLAASADGTRKPLGVLNLLPWTRPFPDESQSSLWPFKEKEQERWTMGVDSSVALLSESCRAIHVMDREGDDYQILEHLASLPRGDGLIVRICHDRKLAKALPLPNGEATRLYEALRSAEAVFEREVVLSPRSGKGRTLSQRKHHPPRDGRLATLQVSCARVRLARPESQPSSLAAQLQLNAVRVWEKDPPEGEKAVEWLLLTTEPCESVEDLEKIVDRYRARWLIEEFNKAAKTGCSLEKRRFESLDALLHILGLLVPIACQLLLLRHLCRFESDAPAESALTRIQVGILRQKGTLQVPRPSVRHALLAVAALGGWLKHNGEPGWIVLTRGMCKLVQLEEGYRLALAAMEAEPMSATAEARKHTQLLALQREKDVGN